MSDVLAEADKRLAEFRALAMGAGLTWNEEKTPKPQAVRAFSAFTGDYAVMVMQANVEGLGVVCDGMLTYGTGIFVKMPRELADEIYHKAAASRN